MWGGLACRTGSPVRRDSIILRSDYSQSRGFGALVCGSLLGVPCFWFVGCDQLGTATKLDKGPADALGEVLVSTFVIAHSFAAAGVMVEALDSSIP
jgi:hypothetical protein